MTPPNEPLCKNCRLSYKEHGNGRIVYKGCADFEPQESKSPDMSEAILAKSNGGLNHSLSGDTSKSSSLLDNELINALHEAEKGCYSDVNFGCGNKITDTQGKDRTARGRQDKQNNH